MAGIDFILESNNGEPRARAIRTPRRPHQRSRACLRRPLRAQPSSFLRRIAFRANLSSIYSRLCVTLLSLSNVGVSFGATELFKNVIFTVADGERWGIIGRNGAGKTS